MKKDLYKYNLNLRQEREIGINPKYLSRAARAKLPETAFQDYEKAVKEFKDKIRREEVEAFKKKHPNANQIIRVK